MMQTLFRNPLAGPFVLGISSGASLGVAIFVMAAGIGGLSIIGMPFVGSLGLVGASMLGSVLVMMLVIAVSVRVNDSVSILIIGIMFGSITGAIVSVLEYFSDPDTVHSFLVWTFGSISGVTWNQFVIFAPIVVTGILFTLFMQKPLNALLLGENYARGIGVDVKRSRLWIILLTSVIAGGLTAFTGPIAFIGVAVPHLARNLLKSSDHRILIPATICIGSILMLCCDIISQMPGSNQVLPINSVTALFGAPVVIWVITRRKRRSLAN
ncbi:MAG: iron ABC transporter permease, partial [Bacteroidetes bacterium]|nr:iron ABC transporter permease [Bacteroidota bacterium]